MFSWPVDQWVISYSRLPRLRNTRKNLSSFESCVVRRGLASLRQARWVETWFMATRSPWLSSSSSKLYHCAAPIREQLQAPSGPNPNRLCVTSNLHQPFNQKSRLCICNFASALRLNCAWLLFISCDIRHIVRRLRRTTRNFVHFRNQPARFKVRQGSNLVHNEWK